MNLGPTELIIVLAIFMLFFGAARLPRLARSLGQSARELKNTTTAIDRQRPRTTNGTLDQSRSWVMLKRFALLLAATTTLAIPTTGAIAAPGTNADGVLPEEACLAAYPPHVQPLLCGRGAGGPEVG